ncbi:MAG: tetratricopeptide repeat protein [Thermodesulfobacteriota bacterium]
MSTATDDGSVKKGFLIGGIVLVFAIGGYLVGSNFSGNASVDGNGSSAEVQYTQRVVEEPPPVADQVILGDLMARLDENPEDAELISRVADTYFGMRRFEDASEYYKRAIKINPDDVDSYNDLALSSHYMGLSVEGLKYVEDGIAKNPYYQRIWLTKGFILAYGLGNQVAAVEAWEKVVKIDPETQVAKAAADFITQFGEKK